ncbi:MAG: DUF938 domain-containing protein [Gammaproteobacteria bacterium]|nr:DUF938 domain-containing protein [Gammaproteobacteria bacterium]
MQHWSEAAARNQWPILEVLRKVLPLEQPVRVLEIGSGTAQHAVCFAQYLDNLEWQPSDLEENFPAIIQTLAQHPHPRVRSPLVLSARSLAAHRADTDVVYTANTCHIMAWSDVQHMVANVGRLLAPGGRFLIYGPFLVGGQPDCESNYRFDQYLSQVNPHQGLRGREDIAWLADRHGMSLVARFGMPANNQMLVFEKRSLSSA